MLTLSPSAWRDYELIDTGDGEKLERYGSVILARPEPHALWRKALSDKEWQQRAQVRFISDGRHSGTWKKKIDVPEGWPITYDTGELVLRFRVALTRTKQVGLFPEQASNWDFIFKACRDLPQAKVLNLFAYTGGASLAARAGGAEVTHCDAFKPVVTWARMNMEASALTDIRWIVEDAFKFVKREVRRDSRYHGIVLDPPAFGRGPRGEQWKLEELLPELLSELHKILDPEKGFVVLNAYSLNFSSMVVANVMQDEFKPGEKLESGELYLRDQAGRQLPAGVFGRFRFGLPD